MSIAFWKHKGKEVFESISLNGAGNYAPFVWVFCAGVLAGLSVGFWGAQPIAYQDMTLARVPSCMTAVIEENTGTVSGGSSAPPAPKEGSVVGSTKGSKYHFPWCPGASQIKEENKLWFTNESQAQQAGYTKAANCQ